MADQTENTNQETPETVDVELTDDMKEELDSMGKGEEEQHEKLGNS